MTRGAKWQVVRNDISKHHLHLCDLRLHSKSDLLWNTEEILTTNCIPRNHWLKTHTNTISSSFLLKKEKNLFEQKTKRKKYHFLDWSKKQTNKKQCTEYYMFVVCSHASLSILALFDQKWKLCLCGGSDSTAGDFKTVWCFFWSACQPPAKFWSECSEETSGAWHRTAETVAD